MNVNSILSIQYFVGEYLKSSESSISVLNVGSYDVDDFSKCHFNVSHLNHTGLGMIGEADGDVVPKNVCTWKEIVDSSYDVVISGEALEHSDVFWVTISEMVRVLRLGGLICIAIPKGFVHPRPPVDSYRFDTDGIVSIARYCNLIPLHASCNLAKEGSSSDWYVDGEVDTVLIAQKPLDWNGSFDDDKYVLKVTDVEDLEK